MDSCGEDICFVTAVVEGEWFHEDCDDIEDVVFDHFMHAEDEDDCFGMWIEQEDCLEEALEEVDGEFDVTACMATYSGDACNDDEDDMCWLSMQVEGEWFDADCDEMEDIVREHFSERNDKKEKKEERKEKKQERKEERKEKK